MPSTGILEWSHRIVAAKFPPPRADVMALHHVCSMPFTTFPFDIWPTAIACLTVGKRAGDLSCFRVWSGTKPCLYATQCKPEAISIISEISQLTRWHLKPFLAGYFLSKHSMLLSMLFFWPIFLQPTRWRLRCFYLLVSWFLLLLLHKLRAA